MFVSPFNRGLLIVWGFLLLKCFAVVYVLSFSCVFFFDVLFCCMSFGFDRLFLRVYFEEETLSLCFVDLSSILLPRRSVFVRIFSVFLSLILAVSLVVISLYLCFFFFFESANSVCSDDGPNR